MKSDTAPFPYTDEHSIDTPEQVALRFPLAGLGSRFLALALDMLIQGAVTFVLFIIAAIALAAGAEKLMSGMSGTAAKWFVAGLILFYFLLIWGYFALFEAFRNGQTPGKRVVKIRVIKDSGRQITFFEALARNLVRVVDAMPGPYLVGVISILCTRSNKRLGDMVADTIVVHERVDEFGGYTVPSAGRTFSAGLFETPAAPAPAPSGIPADHIARLGADDLHLIDSFLARAFALPMETRALMGSRLLDQVCARMDVPVPTDAPPERTLESLSYALRAQGRR